MLGCSVAVVSGVVKGGRRYSTVRVFWGQSGAKFRVRRVMVTYRADGWGIIGRASQGGGSVEI